MHWLIKGLLRMQLYQIRAGKVQKNRSGFSGRFKGFRGKFAIPRLVFFLPLFLLEKQKKKWDCTCKFVEGYQPYARIKNMQNKAGTASDPSRPLPEIQLVWQIGAARGRSCKETGRLFGLRPDQRDAESPFVLPAPLRPSAASDRTRTTAYGPSGSGTSQKHCQRSLWH